MEVIAGEATERDTDAFLAALETIGKDHGSLVQAFDARYIVDEAHLSQAVRLARRAREQGEAIADDPTMEVLLYAAGTRQIDRALTLGVKPGDHQAAILVAGGEERAAAAAVRDRVIERRGELNTEVPLVTDWFEITPSERAATAASLSALVQERVALVALET